MEGHPPIPLEYARTIMDMMQPFEARSMDDVDYDAIARVADWIYGQYPALRQSHRLCLAVSYHLKGGSLYRPRANPETHDEPR